MPLSFPGEDQPATDCQVRAILSARERDWKRSWGVWGTVAALGLLGGRSAWGQESLRSSLAGQWAAEARREAAKQTYNTRLGPVSLRFSGQLGIEADDNVRVVADNQEADLIFRPQLTVSSLWRVSQENSLNLSLGVGYAKYLNTTEYDNLFVAPGSNLGFDVYVHDFVINFHDRFYYSQDVSSDPTVSGRGSLSRYENTAGTSVTWDLNKAVLSFGYDYQIYEVTEPEFKGQSHTSNLGTVSAGFQVIGTLLMAGVEAGGGLTDYAAESVPDNEHLFAGLFISARPSQYTRVRLSGGLVTYFFDSQGNTIQGTNTPSVNVADSVSAYYFDLMVQQQLSRAISHSLSAGRRIRSGYFSGTTDELYFRHEATWRLFRRLGMRTGLSYENASQPGGGEALERYGLNINFGLGLSRRTHASLGYQFYFKTSDVGANEYTQNRLVLTVGYTF